MTPSIRHLWKRTAEKREGWDCTFELMGIVLRRTDKGGVALLSPLVDGYITQLMDEGLLEESESGYLLSWSNLYAALESGAYEELASILRLPAPTTTRPMLKSQGSLTDSTFEISIGGWLTEAGRIQLPAISGGLLDFGDSKESLSAAQWSLVTAVQQFAIRSKDEHNVSTHRAAWASTRRLAKNSNAVLDAFLERSVVLAPERLAIELRRSEEVDGVVEVEPTFAGAPKGWLQHFDKYKQVPDRYDIATAEGIVQVIVAPKVRTVLEEIKRFPGRRVAGRRARAFLSNPFALLGEDANEVIDEAQFEAAKEIAGIQYERFSALVERDLQRVPTNIGILIESASPSGIQSSSNVWMDDDQIRTFVDRVNQNLQQDLQFVAWDGYDLEIQGDTADQVVLLVDALAARRNAELLVNYDEVYDLTNYSGRVEGIGTDRPFYSPYLAKKKDDQGWFPENVQPLIAHNSPDGDTSVVIKADDELLEDIEQAVRLAEQANADVIDLPSLPVPMPIEQATEILKALKGASAEIKAGTYTPRRRTKAKSLLIKANIVSVDYAEKRAEALDAGTATVELPTALLSHVKLLPHQESGIAWLQHLYRNRERHTVRGAVLADDMGLGKTLQLLAFMARIMEDDPAVPPMLVVAPVALLENWKEEVARFFQPGTMQMLIAYGENLDRLRIPKEQIDQRLRDEDGLVKFLKPDWVGKARLVLTTYETLRDFEFGFARQRWSVMVCDEAQRIKNPAAMVTRAAKKQHVQFKIACTGTPVENALVDLWCLYDFVQPGLLGALNEFGSSYSKPIEAKTPEQKAKVEELRERIAPQIMRRTKMEVAKDLPAKRIVEGCRSLPISAHQRNLYSKAIEDFRNRKTAGSRSQFKNHLGLLQYLRAICTDPQRYGQSVFSAEAINEYRSKAPKLDWLLRQLANIKRLDEKAIVFCEFREIQRLLQHYIKESLGISADIINGDTTAKLESDVSRQKRLKAFQAAPGFGVIILSPLAVGFGVNIQAANHVIHYTRTWNPAKEDQATDRAYRIGQTKEVFVYYPTVIAEDFTTFEAKLDVLLTRKRELASDMLNGSGDVSFEDIGLADVAPASQQSGLDERMTLETVHRLTARYFEKFVAVLWGKMGYTCHVTPLSGDHGIDVIAIKNSEGLLLQAKSSGVEGQRLNWDAVKEVVTGAATYRAQYRGVSFRTVCVTNRQFNSGAQQHAKLNDVDLFDQDNLAALLREYSVMESELESTSDVA